MSLRETRRADGNRTLGQKFAGGHLYEIPECHEEVIVIPFSREEEVMYR